MKLTGSEYPVTHDEIRAVLGGMERGAAALREARRMLRGGWYHDLPPEVDALLAQAEAAVDEWVKGRFPERYYREVIGTR